jgi:hypothetical protein
MKVGTDLQVGKEAFGLLKNYRLLMKVDGWLV